MVCSLGATLSVGAVVYSSLAYWVLSRAAEPIATLAAGQDMFTQKVEVLLADHRNKNLIVDELKSRFDKNKALQESLSNFVANSKTKALIETLLWVSAALLFAVLRFKLGKLSRRDKTQTSKIGE